MFVCKFMGGPVALVKILLQLVSRDYSVGFTVYMEACE